VADHHRLVTVAGEASGDLIASRAISCLLTRHDTAALEVAGVGGERLRSAGMTCWYDSQSLAVRGYVEALSRLPQILWVRHRLLQQIDRWKPRVYLGVDAPDFNLGVEIRCRSAGIRTVHLISPSIWAWRPERIHKIARAVDHMLCIFPFEPACYQGSRVRATYVGHPLADMIPKTPDQHAARRALGLAQESRPVIAVLPGSRVGEILHNGETFFDAATLLSQHAQVIVPAASMALAERIRQMPAFERAAAAGTRLLVGDSNSATHGGTPISHQALAACDVTLVASGTATLEAALFKRPMVISYRIPALSYWLMRRKALIHDIGLPNILLGERVVPELIQEQVTPLALAQAVRHWLDHPKACQQVTDRFHALHDTLRQDAAVRVADILHAELAGL
jgi:lipid-A-disaccharide synthase